jgi:hypothetical protein
MKGGAVAEERDGCPCPHSALASRVGTARRKTRLMLQIRPKSQSRITGTQRLRKRYSTISTALNAELGFDEDTEVDHDEIEKRTRELVEGYVQKPGQ